MDRTSRLKFFGLWLLIGLIAAAASSLKWPSAHMGDEYLPYSIDSFYHASRILDTVADAAKFYEFDSKIHAPEGSLLTWPWGYDYAMAWVVKAAMAVGIPGTPIAILIWLPVLAVFATVGLTMLIARRLGLTTPFVVIAGLATALSPLTQHLHGVGQIDHHYAEHIFVLATIASGLHWLAHPHDRRAALIVGAVLGAAPAIHNGLFVLQLPLLAALLVLWLQGVRMPMRTTVLFAASLLATTLAILIPSLPFRLGLFEYYTLSWFHLYVAFGSAIAALAFSALANNRRGIAILVIAAVVLVLPLAHQIMLVRGFLAGTSTRLETINEMRSLPRMAASPVGRLDLTLMYSLLLWVLPLLLIYCGWSAWKERAQARIFFWVCCILGVALLTTQLRMHYFGSFALYLPWLVLAQRLVDRWPARHKTVVLSLSLVFLLAYWWPARYQLPSVSAPAGDQNLRALRPTMEVLRKACAEDPGIVLADNDAGHYIRYYTDCSVIANNFLLTPQHAQKIKQIDYLTSIPANAFPGVAPFVRYILLRPVSIIRGKEDIQYMSYSQRVAPLIDDLLLKPVSDVPPNYVLLEQVNLREQQDEESVPYIRVFKVNPVAPQARVSGTAEVASPKPVGH